MGKGVQVSCDLLHLVVVIAYCTFVNRILFVGFVFVGRDRGVIPFVIPTKAFVYLNLYPPSSNKGTTTNGYWSVYLYRL